MKIGYLGVLALLHLVWHSLYILHAVEIDYGSLQIAARASLGTACTLIGLFGLFLLTRFSADVKSELLMLFAFSLSSVNFALFGGAQSINPLTWIGLVGLISSIWLAAFCRPIAAVVMELLPLRPLDYKLLGVQPDSTGKVGLPRLIAVSFVFTALQGIFISKVIA